MSADQSTAFTLTLHSRHSHLESLGDDVEAVGAGNPPRVPFRHLPQTLGRVLQVVPQAVGHRSQAM